MSGLVVIDLDNGGGKCGEENFAATVDALGIEIPETLTATTGNGKHLFFRCPGTQISNSASRIAPGVDVRADGGYVVAAPSTHANGRQYSFDNPVISVAEIPAPLLDIIRGPKTNAINKPESTVMGDNGIPEGTRNDTLYRIGCSLRGQLAMEYPDIVNRLVLYNQSNCVPPIDESEVLAIAQSVCKHPAESGSKRSLKRQEKNPLYWFPWNTRDFNADAHIQSMTDYQFGWYTRLRTFAWQNAGVLPADTSALRRLARAESKKTFERDCALVLAEYHPTILLGNPVLLNRRMASEYANTLDKWLKVKAAGDANRDRIRETHDVLDSMTGTLTVFDTQTIQ